MKHNFRSKLFFVPGILMLVLLISVPSKAQQMIQIDKSNLGRKFEGIGALSAGGSSRLLIDYPEPYRSLILDYLFKPKFGASLQQLKVEIGGDINSTCGTEPSYQHNKGELNFNAGYEWWLMKEAKKRNSRIYLDALEWGAPYWIGNGNFYSQDNADYIAKYILGAKKIHGLDIDYVGIWNETPYNTDWIKTLHSTLKLNKIATSIVGAEEIRAWNIVAEMNKDAELFKAIDVIGVHYPRGQGDGLTDTKIASDEGAKNNLYVTKEAVSLKKPLWASEDGPWRGDWRGAKGLIKSYIRNYIDVKVTKTIIWSLITSYYDNITISNSGLMKANQPWSGHFDVQPAIWATAHLTQFAEPGWHYLEGQGNGYLSGKGSYAALTSPDNKELSIILETVDALQPQKVKFKLDSEFNNRIFYLWKTDSLSQFVKLLPSRIKNAELSLTLDEGAIYSLTTTTGQQKGVVGKSGIPKSAGFRLPYRESYESYGQNSLPKFSSDISGAFEIAGGNKNKYLKQKVLKKGIEWTSSLNTEPFTMIGDTALTDYSIKLDVRLNKNNQSVYLIGRIPKVVQNDIQLPGYWLKFSTDGTYRLGKSGTPVSAGHFDLQNDYIKNQRFFIDDTANDIVLNGSEIHRLPDSVKAIFDGLTKVLADPANSDIILILYKNGSFSITKENILASGKIDFPIKSWHSAKLLFKGNTINAFWDNVHLFNINDSSFTNGYCGWGSGWHEAEFDNLVIE
ncbi:hypothetical protein FFF34_014805 [Inquilinus sp. KBS0705]|nr:hypothetical protein FFF34_014805 [Inquilinus sp. KBS0705]